MVRALEAEGYSVWWDPHIAPGQDAQPGAQGQASALATPATVFVADSAINSVLKQDVKTQSSPQPELQLPAGTEIVAHTTNAISSGLESPVVAVVDRSVKVGDTVVIPEGAHVIGHTAGAAKDRVNVRFTSVVLPNDREIPISGLGLMKDGTAGLVGRVKGKGNPVLAGECLCADYFETDFASFLAWRDWGFPDQSVFNGFGMGALRSRDGAFVMGEMSQHTANARRIYFPSGTPDLADIRDDAVDIAGSVGREVEEETGLTPADYRASPHWDCVLAGRAVAMIRILQVDMPGEALRRRIEANLAAQQMPELSAIHLVRSASDLTAAMPRFVTAFIESQFAG